MFKINPRVFTIADQLLLSAIGFITSAAIVKLGGIEQLGVYGAFMAVVTLVQTSYSSLVSGQMLLQISGKSNRLKNTLFRLSEIIWFFYAVFAVLATVLLSYVISQVTDSLQSETVLYAGMCVVSISLFEQHRKLLYVNNCFLISFVLTCVFLFSHLGVSYFLITKNSFYYSAEDAFLSLTIAYFVAAIVNPVAISAVRNAKKINASYIVLLHQKYLEHGKFAFGGLSLAWIQNQSISVYILAIFGPAVAGLFSLGRLITMPILVVNTGLINGILPTLRILGSNNELAKLGALTHKYAIVGFLLNLLFAVFIVIALKMDWVLNLQEDLANAKHYIYFWLMLTMGIVWRTWVTQFLIANFKFRTLLKYNAVAAAVVLIGIILFTLLGFSPLLIACVLLVGEIVNYLLVKAEKNRILNNEPVGE